MLFLLILEAHISKSFTCFWIRKEPGSIAEHWKVFLLKLQTRILDIACNFPEELAVSSVSEGQMELLHFFTEWKKSSCNDFLDHSGQKNVLKKPVVFCAYYKWLSLIATPGSRKNPATKLFTAGGSMKITNIQHQFEFLHPLQLHCVHFLIR